LDINIFKILNYGMKTCVYTTDFK